MAVESGAGPLLNEQRQQLARELSDAAQSLNRAAVAAERLARFVTDIDFEASASEQQTQFMAALSATKDLQTTFSLSTAVQAAGKKRGRKDKVAKDPDAPKKPITSYLFFQEAKRKELSAKHPELPYKEVLKLLGVEWRSMSDADKEPYVRAHEKALAQHGADIVAYEKTKGTPPTAEKSKTDDAAKSGKAKDQKPAAKPKAGAVTTQPSKAKAAAAAVTQMPESASESSEEESSDESESTEDESESEAPPPKKSKVGTKPATPAKTTKRDAKAKEKKK